MIEDYITTDITISNRSGFDKFAAPTFSTPVAVKCRWQEKTKQFRDVNGQTVIADIIIFLDADTTIANEDRVIKGGVNYKVVQVSKKSFIEEDSHIEALLQYEH